VKNLNLELETGTLNPEPVDSGPRLLAHNSKLITHNLASERNEHRVFVRAHISG